MLICLSLSVHHPPVILRVLILKLKTLKANIKLFSTDFPIRAKEAGVLRRVLFEVT